MNYITQHSGFCFHSNLAGLSLYTLYIVPSICFSSLNLTLWQLVTAHGSQPQLDVQTKHKVSCCVSFNVPKTFVKLTDMKDKKSNSAETKPALSLDRPG